MSIVNIVRNVKQMHPYDITLVKFGKFYHAYGKDAYIISYIFNYQLKKVETNTNTTGFPEGTLEKVIQTLNSKSINYLMLDRSTNYEIVSQCDFKDKNRYEEVFHKAHKYMSRKNKIDAIYEYLMNNINDDLVKEQIAKIEDVLYEGMEI